ncbi:MAG TPA: prolyl oligopeptidase family serine peptidase [Acidimicrobiales bacterium]|nr:prolyl oligopeptidase family serine peptidase [Acidimicrobiales bacterium]
MSPQPELSYGSWPTPVTSELVVRSAHLPNQVRLDGDDVWWSEARPEEGGRYAVLRRDAEGGVEEVLPEPWNARSGVHEYGGGAWWVRDGVLWFVDWTTQRLHRVDPGGEPVPLTPEPEVPRGLRYADGDVSPDGRTLLCVREEHRPDGTVLNTIVWLDAVEASDPAIVVEGPDFVSDPRWRADGDAFCWLEWDQPDMPWDATRLVVDDEGVRRTVAGGEQRESICQPLWASDGSLWFASDRSGFWSLHRWSSTGGVEPVLDLQRDIGFPQWVFGERCFGFLDDGRIVVTYVDGGMDRLAVREAAGPVRDLELGITAVSSLEARGDRVVLVAASPTVETHVAGFRLPADELVTPVVERVVPARDLGLEPSWWSVPEGIEFPTAGGGTAYALWYPPTNPEVTAPAEERPPLLVFIHGGPTAAARPMLRLSTQYWTSRGFAVVDVNYRGSTGYGRAFRDLLQGQWGVADVEDCVAVARHLADRGLVDPDRLLIRGGSAGGFTTLAALAFHDVFAAGASHYGVADLGLLAAETHKFEARYLDGLVGPWPEARATYDARSPIHHLEGIDRPLAVFQGDEDAIVPPDQAELIVDGLRTRGIPVAYVLFEGEGHGFRKADNIRASLDGELSFYAQVLGFALPPDEGIEPIKLA